MTGAAPTIHHSLRGERSFHPLVLAGAGSPTAAFDIGTLRYRSNSEPNEGVAALARVTGEAWPDAPTLFETAPLRGLVTSARNKADPELVRAVLGYDAFLVLSGSTASTNL